MLIAITREVSASLGRCELSYVPRVEIDPALAREQHDRYRNALSALGCEVIARPAVDDLPDAVFVEDLALVLDEVAILTRPGVPSRQPEGASVAPTLRRYRPLLAIKAVRILPKPDVSFWFICATRSWLFANRSPPSPRKINLIPSKGRMPDQTPGSASPLWSSGTTPTTTAK